MFASKSILARLLAKENITVVQRNTATASFDVVQRLLTLPNFEDMSPDLYDLFVGHEVAHATDTPADFFVTIGDRKIPKSYLNIIEDIRIERIAIKQYPGLRRAFVAGYKELLDRKFFCPSVDLDTPGNPRTFMDRLNVLAKTRGQRKVEFSSDEIPYVKLAMKVETFEDVLDASENLARYIRNKIKGEAPDADAPIDFEGEFEQTTESGETTESGDVEEKDTEGGGNKPGGDGVGKMDSEDEDPPLSDDDLDDLEEDVKSGYDLERAMSGLASSTQGKIVGKFDTSNILIPFEEAHEARRFSTGIRAWGEKELAKFTKKTRPMVSAIFREFELRRRAETYSKSKTATSGELDTKKLTSYKFSEDLFKTSTITPKGKSHGFVGIVDFSGSMHSSMHGAIQQTIILATFARRAGIKFKIMSFTDMHCRRVVPTEEKIGFELRLVELLSSDMSGETFWRACVDLMCIKRGGRSFVDTLGGTPLEEALAAAYIEARDMKNRFRIDRMSIVAITDGIGGGFPVQMVNMCATHAKIGDKLVEVSSDPTSYRRMGHVQLLEALTRDSDIRTVNFYIASNGSAAYASKPHKGFDLVITIPRKSNALTGRPVKKIDISPEMMGQNDTSVLTEALSKNISQRNDAKIVARTFAEFIG